VLIDATTANSSRKIGFRPRFDSLCTGSTRLVVPPDDADFTGDLTVDFTGARMVTCGISPQPFSKTRISVITTRVSVHAITRVINGGRLNRTPGTLTRRRQARPKADAMPSEISSEPARWVAARGDRVFSPGDRVFYFTLIQTPRRGIPRAK